MLLNRIEYALMNNPVRAAIQRHVEVRHLLNLGGRMRGGRALEIGCGRGVGTALILERFGADSVDAFDLDPRMVELARKRLARHGSRVRLWVGDAGAISAPAAAYDAVFDFGIIHHVSAWRSALGEVHRVLKPGGRFYAEEVLESFIVHPLSRYLLEHPQSDRFDSASFLQGTECIRLRGHRHQGDLGGVRLVCRTETGHMTHLETIIKRFEAPDEVREFEKGRLELVTIAGQTLGRATYQPGWKWSVHVGPLTGRARCEVEHLGIVLAGHATAAFDDGRVFDLTAGAIFYIPPEPHDSWVVGDEPYVSLHLLGAGKYAK